MFSLPALIFNLPFGAPGCSQNPKVTLRAAHQEPATAGKKGSVWFLPSRELLEQNDCRSKLRGCRSNLGWQDEEQREGHDANAGCAAIQQCSRSVKGNGRRKEGMEREEGWRQWSYQESLIFSKLHATRKCYSHWSGKWVLFSGCFVLVSFVEVA